MTRSGSKAAGGVDGLSTKEAQRLLLKLGLNMYEQLHSLEPPTIRLPSRSTDNIVFDSESQQYVLGPRKITREFANIRGAKSLAQLLWTAYVANELIRSDQVTTLRDLFYTSLNEKRLEITEQSETDAQIEDLEAVLGIPRENFNVIPHDRGTIFGKVILEYNVRGFEGNRVDLMSHPDGVSIGPGLAQAHFVSSQAQMVVVIEKHAVFIQMIREKIFERLGAILIETGGQASRAARILIRRLNKELGLPVYILTDADPWGMHIALVIISGSAKSAHIRDINTPSAKWLGFWATDIERYGVPSLSLSQVDYKRINELKIDPRYKDGFLKKQIKFFEEKGRKAELEAFSSKNKAIGVTYLANTYLPQKLKALGAI
ncbi:MAG: DNA topoisomerase IV subunit A [Candidatus Marsarchaeota archaeon]|nr:DNA topoisomerase IV subunit A [Candidatus Marsarchaeota archaeon]